MVTAVASTPKQRPPSLNPKRPPLLPSDSDNAPPRRARAREVTSRYLSLSTSSSSSNSSASTNTTASSVTSSGSMIPSRRAQSPMFSGRGSSAAASTPKTQQRAVSAERRRPLAAAATPSSAEKLLVKSVRSLSVSFQGQSYSLPVSKVKPPPAAAGTPGVSRKGTPERRKAGVNPVRDRAAKDRDTPRPIEQQQQQQHLWPGRLRSENPSLLSRSLDYGTERGKLGLRKSVDTELKLESREIEDPAVSDGGRSGLGGGSLNSDAESVSSEGTVSGNATQLRGGSRGIVVAARFWQDNTSNRAQKLLDPASPLSNSALNRTGSAKPIAAKKFQIDSPVSSPRDFSSKRGPSPLRGASRAASPSRAMNSGSGALLRGMASPIRARNGVGSVANDNNMCSTPSLISFPIELRRGKFGENRISDAHDLRMLYNRLLQWRLTNAKVENTLLVQKHAAERNLYNAWVNTSKLRHSVKSKRIELQTLRRNLKLYSILKEQEPHLERWGLLDRDYCNSVSGAIKALEASTLRLPIADGARADVHKVQEAIYSAVDVMQAMESSIHSLQLKVERMNSLATDLSKLSAREHGLLNQCKELFSATFVPLEVINWSLQIQVLQVRSSQESFSKKA